jgi:hypothetical protein
VTPNYELPGCCLPDAASRRLNRDCTHFGAPEPQPVRSILPVPHPRLLRRTRDSLLPCQQALGRWDFLPVERLVTHWETLAGFILLWCQSPRFGLFLARAAPCWAQWPECAWGATASESNHALPQRRLFLARFPVRGNVVEDPSLEAFLEALCRNSLAVRGAT